MKKGIFLLLLLFFTSNTVFAGGPEKLTNPWMIYLGAYGGYNIGYFEYGGNYFSTIAGAVGGNVTFHNDAVQIGALGGAQVGVQYHFSNPYFVGFSFSGTMNSSKARVIEDIEDAITTNLTAFNVNNEFRLEDNLDLAFILGADVTSNAHVYLKAGATCSRFSETLFITRAEIFPFPIPINPITNKTNIWGFLLGLGITYDIGRWVSTFAEYDHYDYGVQNLNAFNNINPLPSPVNRDHLTHHVTISSSALHVGLNVKFMDNNHLWHRVIRVLNPWMVYIGGFGGYSGEYFQYGANYFANVNSNTAVHNDALQTGVLGGGQVGFQYHFQNPYFAGVSFSGAMNANKAQVINRITNTISAPAQTAFDIHSAFRLEYNLDLAAILGADITRDMHVYAKAGVTEGRFAQSIFTARAQLFPFPIPFNQRTDKDNVWGFVLGLGMTYDLGRWISAFAEYDHYDYGRQNLNAINRINPVLSTFIDHLTQNVRISVDAVRLGLNLKFMDNHHPWRSVRSINPWMVYIGGYGGYNTVHFQYGANFFSTIAATVGGNIGLENDAVQIGVLGGGQFGAQYHFQNPYFVGLSFSATANANKARVTKSIENAIVTVARGFDVHNEFRLKYNLDLALILGADITRDVHVYVKAGAANTQLREKFFTTPTQAFPFPTPVNLRADTRSLWGYLLGLGLTYDLSRRVNTFVEYDHYDYGTLNLNSFDNITPVASVNSDRLTQHLAIMANSYRIGLNLMFNM